MAKTTYWVQPPQKRIDVEKMVTKMKKNCTGQWTVLFMKRLKNRRNRIVVKLKSNEKDYMNWTSKPSYMSQKIFDNDLVAMHRSKVRSTRNKSVYVGILAIILLSQNMIIQANRWLVKWKMNMWIRYYRICWIKAKDVLSLVRWR